MGDVRHGVDSLHDISCGRNKTRCGETTLVPLSRRAAPVIHLGAGVLCVAACGYGSMLLAIANGAEPAAASQTAPARRRIPNARRACDRQKPRERHHAIQRSQLSVGLATPPNKKSTRTRTGAARRPPQSTKLARRRASSRRAGEEGCLAISGSFLRGQWIAAPPTENGSTGLRVHQFRTAPQPNRSAQKPTWTRAASNEYGR